MKPTTNPITIFEQQWALYQKGIRLNVMYHREIEKILSSYLSKLGKKESPTILDLGCGDSHIISNILKSQNFESYLGIDLAEAAITAGFKNFVEKGISQKVGAEKIQYRQDNILHIDAYAQKQHFNCINTGYAIHHLSKAQKYQLYDGIYKKLSKGGLFLYVDLYKSKYVSLATYLKRYYKYLATWDGFSEAEKQLVIDHISVYDFPENEEEVLAYLRKLGFEKIHYERFDSFHRIAIFQK